MLVKLLPTQHTVTVVKGDTRDRRESHYWLEIDGLIYDLTQDQFQETLGSRFEGIDPRYTGQKASPTRIPYATGIPVRRYTIRLCYLRILAGLQVEIP